MEKTINKKLEGKQEQTEASNEQIICYLLQKGYSYAVVSNAFVKRIDEKVELHITTYELDGIIYPCKRICIRVLHNELLDMNELCDYKTILEQERKGYYEINRRAF